eukprot:353600-Chlamydomonas_euryale.AAC.13
MAHGTPQSVSEWKGAHGLPPKAIRSCRALNARSCHHATWSPTPCWSTCLSACVLPLLPRPKPQSSFRCALMAGAAHRVLTISGLHRCFMQHDRFPGFQEHSRQQEHR